MADPALCAKFGRAGRKRAEEKFGWSKIAQETKALYEQLLGVNCPRSARLSSRARADGEGPSPKIASCARTSLRVVNVSKVAQFQCEVALSFASPSARLGMTSS